MHLNSKLLFDKYAREYCKEGSGILEIGPDGFPSAYQKSLAGLSLNWETIDMYEDSRLTHRAIEEYSFPVPDNTYDVVIAGQVLEHVRKIWVWMKEVSRVCKSGGYVIIICPVSWTFHEAPVDCWRVYPEGIRALFDEANLEVIMATWESLETPNYKRYIPGISHDNLRDKRKLLNRINGILGLPVERSYDTIAIGRKP